MKLRWLGHSCFELTLPGGTVVTDPYDDTVGYPPLHVRAVAILSSHGHFDHNYFQAVDGDPVILNTPGLHEACGARITAVPACASPIWATWATCPTPTRSGPPFQIWT